MLQQFLQTGCQEGLGDLKICDEAWTPLPLTVWLRCDSTEQCLELCPIKSSLLFVFFQWTETSLKLRGPLVWAEVPNGKKTVNRIGEMWYLFISGPS